MLGELVQLALQNIGRARARLFMTAGGVVVGTTAVTLLIALTIGLQRTAEQGLGSDASLTEITVYPNFSVPADVLGGVSDDDEAVLNAQGLARLAQIEGVRAVIPLVNLQAGELIVGKLTGWSQVIGVPPEYMPIFTGGLAQGEYPTRNGQVIVGQRAGEYLSDPKSNDGSTISQDLYTTPFALRLYRYTSGGTPRRYNLTPSGQLRSGTSYDYAMIMTLDEVLRLNEWITGKTVDRRKLIYEQVLVRTQDRSQTLAVSDAIREMGFGVSGMGDFLNQLNGFFNTMRLVLGGVGGIALIVAAFGVANTMMMAILERTHEIGIMKAIGATDRDVLLIFLIEAGLIGLVGALVGIFSSLVLGDAINQALMNAPRGDSTGGGMSFLPFDTSQLGNAPLIVIPSDLMLFVVLLGTLIGLLAGVYPALRAARMTPVLALKME